MNVTPITDSYASAYADAVLAFLASGTIHEIYFDVDAAEFRSHPVEDGTAPDDVMQFISSGWDQGIGEVGAEKNPKSPRYSATALHYAIVATLSESGFAAQNATLLVRAAESPKDYL